MKNKVFASFENVYNDHCVDIFERADGSFGYEEFRRDAEDCGAWQSLARYSQQVFATQALALAAANGSIHWLAESEIWQRHLASHAALPVREPRPGQPTSGEPMFDHVKFGASDYAASKAFFLAALAPIGIAVVSEGTPAYGAELSADGKTSLCICQTGEKPAHLHLAFVAQTRQQVDAFHRAALEAGGKDHGAPGLRPHYHANYYAAFVIAPDGHNIEVVCHAPAA